MKYLELKIELNKAILDDAVDVLADAGFESLMIDDPADFAEIAEHPEWYKYDYINEELAAAEGQTPAVTLYFSNDEEGRAEAERAERVLQDFKDSDAVKKDGNCIAWTLGMTGDDSEWLYKWQEHFKPTRIGENIVVKPSWEDCVLESTDLVIEMDPGMAFGSGLHETTSLCIKALEKKIKPVEAARDSSDTGARVLDVGTGTGILAIAAMKLGAHDCLGIDIDEDAVRIAADNIERNGLSSRIEVRVGDLMEGVDYDADIIVANLMADLVIRLTPAAAAELKPGGIFISSGILDIKEEVVSEAVKAAGFEIEEVLHDGEWCAIAARRK